MEICAEIRAHTPAPTALHSVTGSALRVQPSMLQRCPARARLALRSQPTRCLRISARNEVPRRPYSTPPKQDTPPLESFRVEDQYAHHTVSALDVFRRFFKFGFIALASTGLIAATAFEAAHMWVEKVELAPEQDEEAAKWQWDLQADRWTGGVEGGTDPALGFKGRHAVRSAWIAQNWGVGSPGKGASASGSGKVTDPRLEVAQEFLSVAFEIALRRESSGAALRPMTVPELLVRHADVLERTGTRDGLYDAKSDLQRVWARLSNNDLDAARIALKLGDLNNRLGNVADALTWWSRSIHLITEGGEAGNRPSPIPVIPASPPSSPLAQRTLASTLVSLSAFYATSGQLEQAQAVEQSGLDLLRTMRAGQGSALPSPAQALHALYILHRSSLLSIHHAEVLHALRNPAATSVQWLTRAAESSERVARALTGRLQIPASESPSQAQPEAALPPDASVLPVYAKSPSMKKPARGLLRDARRSAAEAWNLVGLLTEESGDPGAMKKSLECYERALGWAGVAADNSGGMMRAAEGVLDAEQALLWGNYARAREAVDTAKKA